jgi:L-ribulose-5-phosphate 4-epimerase
VVETIGQSPAVLLRNHGVFTVGPTAAAAVKAAVMVEDIAATVFAALQLGQPDTLPADVVEKLHRRYTTVYGQ